MKQLLVFYGIACLFSWIAWLPLYGFAPGPGELPALPFLHALGGLGPLIAACVTTGIFHRAAGLKQFAAGIFRVRSVVYLVIALLAPFALAAVASVIHALANGTIPDVSGLWTSREFPDLGLPTLFVYHLVFFGLGEEAGWRGFVLPRLQYRMNALASTCVLTAFWALWHWPLFLYRPGYVSMDVAGITGWVMSLLTGSILLTWLYNASRGSVLICAVFHSTIDLAFTADLADPSIVNYTGFLITIWGIVTLLVFRPKNLSAGEREKIPPERT